MKKDEPHFPSNRSNLVDEYYLECLKSFHSNYQRIMQYKNMTPQIKNLETNYIS